MSNMSYCRFENTLRDMNDCLAALVDKRVDNPSNEELRAMTDMIDCCDDLKSYIVDYLNERMGE